MTRYLDDKFVSALLAVSLLCVGMTVQADDGLGRTREYKDAITGNRPLSEADHKIIKKVSDRILPKNKGYLEVGTALGATKIKDMQNVSQSASATVVEPKASTSNQKLSLGFGYRWEQLSLGADLLMHGKVHYHSSPMLTGGSTQIETDISTLALLGSGRFDLFQTRWVSPYVGLGVGLARNEASSRLKTIAGDLQNRNKKVSKALAYRYTVGAKFFISPINGYLNIGYQSLDLGEFSIGPISNTKLKSKDYKTTGFYLSYIYEF